MGYGAVLIALVGGWMTRERGVLSAEYGFGYVLGIIGATLMVLLLLYPLRKRVRALHRLGSVRIWFRTHMIFGVLGPALILFHCNFSLGSFNSRVALFCTLIVAGSGLMGRYIYARIHHGLYGRRASLEDLRERFADIAQQIGPLGRSTPALVEALATVEAPFQNPRGGVVASLWLGLRAAVLVRLVKFRFRRQLSDALDELASQSSVYAAERARLERNWLRYLSRRVNALRELAQFNLFERLFAAWHVVHFPLFIVMVMAVVVHVIAVHMY